MRAKVRLAWVAWLGCHTVAHPLHLTTHTCLLCHNERHSTEPWLLLLFAQSWLLAALCVCCTAALRLPAALPPQCMQRPVAQQRLSTALRASAAQIRMQSADGAEGEVARRSGVSKGQLVDAISLRAGVSKKTAELVLSNGASHRELAAAA